MTYRVEDGVVLSDSGIPAGQKWFADNRLSVQFDETGVTQVEYRNKRQIDGNAIVFQKALHDGFRYFLEHEGVTYKAEHETVSVWPFGLEATWTFEGSVFTHGIFLANDAIIIKFKTPSVVPENLRFKIEFNESCAFIPADQGNFLLSKMGGTRAWEPWSFHDNTLFGRYTEKLEKKLANDAGDIRSLYVDPEWPEEDAFLNICIGADFEIRYERKSVKHILRTDLLEPDREYFFLVSLSPERNASEVHATAIQNIKKDLNAQLERYKKVSARSPRLESSNAMLNNFVALAPMYLESLKAYEKPGVIRGKSARYWVWGWDGLSSNRASLYWGDHAFIRDLLRFYEKDAHPDLGITHAYRNDMSIASICDLPSQGMYITLLHEYYNATADFEETKSRYGFAKKTFERIQKVEVKDTGLCEGTSLFPDFPLYLSETGHDLSAFNNTVFYCACRSMQFLATLVGDTPFADLCEETFKKIERNFLPLFFNKEKGFIVNSIDSETLEQRDCYSSNAIKYDNDYLKDLVLPISDESLDFFEKHFVSKPGIRPIPVWDKAYDGDANQLHSWWPVMGEYYIRLINEHNRTDLISQWKGWVTSWIGRLTIPEGIPCHINTEVPDHDNWDMLCGAWHGYSGRGWYQALIHGVIGVDTDAGGFTFFPYDGDEIKITGLHFQGGTADIEMSGSGTQIESIEANGQIFKGTSKLPKDAIQGKQHEKIRVVRTSESLYPAFIKEARNVSLSDYQYSQGKIKAKLSGFGTSRLLIGAQSAISVNLDGKPADLTPVGRDFTVEVKLGPGEFKELEILF
jgi:hypothetical protein